ncbi:unnamed protein product [Clavelina lepadiformis]|uniref:Sigma non-opioid intracellular receptor 1 n=1 Tax=Clavelina lepadiformis TaxID=159417 RepID=A0ABP0H463_CLALP
MLRVIIYSVLLSIVVQYYFYGFPASYVFRIKTVKDIGWKYSGSSYSENEIRRVFATNYPENIFKEAQFPWLPSSAGGVHGSIALLYASFTEFLALYHSEIESTGTTGRHFMNISVTVLQGNLMESVDNVAPAIMISPGNSHVLRSGRSSTVKLSSGTTLLLYGRGFLPLSMGHGISNSLFSDCDILLVLATIWHYLKALAVSHLYLWKWAENYALYLWDALSGQYFLGWFSGLMKRIFVTVQTAWNVTSHVAQ